MILTEDQARVLTYVQQANIGGYRPAEAEVEEWRMRPSQQVPDWRGPLAGINGAYGGVRGALEWMRQMGMHPVGAVDETFVGSLIRLRWLSRGVDQRLGVTPLGKALLRAGQEAQESASEVVLLREDDQLAYGRLLGTIAETGDCLIVDPYLRADQLLALLSSTDATRFLIGAKVSKGETVAMITLLSAQGWGRGAELRRAGEGRLHDRYIVGEDAMWTLGTSLNAVGRATSTLLIPIPQDAAAEVRVGLEDVWNQAESLAINGEVETNTDLEADNAGQRV